MKIKILAAVMIGFVLALTSCVLSNNELKPVNPNSKFNAVLVFNNIEVIMTPGEKVSYEVSGDESAVSKLEAGIERNTLIFKADRLSGSDKIHINLTAPIPDSIEVFNNASLIIEGDCDVEDINLGVWNDGRIRINNNITAKTMSVGTFNNGSIFVGSVAANQVNITAANSSTVNISGHIGRLSKSVMNDAVVNITGLTADNQIRASHDEYSKDTVIVYSEDINILGRIFDSNSY